MIMLLGIKELNSVPLIKQSVNLFTSLTGAFKTSHDSSIMVYRGLNNPLHKNIFVDTMTSKSNTFMSTSCTYETAISYAMGEEDGLIFRIIIPANTKICPIFLSTQIKFEKELLLNYGSVFYVLESSRPYLYTTGCKEEETLMETFIDTIDLLLVDQHMPNVSFDTSLIPIS